MIIAFCLLGISIAWVGYTYVGYPLLLLLVGAVRPGRPQPGPVKEWPLISIVVPAYNEERTIAGTLDSLLAIDYPADRRQILVVSDASSDGTDEIVRSYADRGIELLRVPVRRGKTAAENAAAQLLRGSIVVNTDASVRIDPAGVKRLVRQFLDPAVGVASGRDVSVAADEARSQVGESGYVGFDMWTRSLETRAETIVGSSGCFYAIRAHLHRAYLPDSLSRDFASALIAKEHGYRAVSVDDAICFVPRTSSIAREYRRKVRTMTRGVETLWYKRHLLNPLRYPLFSWIVISHKVCRWLLPWPLLVALGALTVLAFEYPLAAGLLAVAAGGILLGVVGWLLDGRIATPLLNLPAYVLVGSVAAIVAIGKALRGDTNAVWEPTRRGAAFSQ